MIEGFMTKLQETASNNMQNKFHPILIYECSYLATCIVLMYVPACCIKVYCVELRTYTCREQKK